MTSEISPHIFIPEAELAFHPERTSEVDLHPLRGLLRFGPYSSGLVPDPIRIATIAPARQGARLYGFTKELAAEFKATERKDYLPAWPGFRKAFNLDMRGAVKDCHVELDDRLEAEMKDSATPHVVLADRLLRAIQSLEARRDAFDIVFIYIPQSWASGFVGSAGDDFDLHDHLKAATAARRIPIQLVREDRALAYPDRASVMWRIGLAIYAKAGGVPWKLADNRRNKESHHVYRQSGTLRIAAACEACKSAHNGGDTKEPKQYHARHPVTESRQSLRLIVDHFIKRQDEESGGDHAAVLHDQPPHLEPECLLNTVRTIDSRLSLRERLPTLNDVETKLNIRPQQFEGFCPVWIRQQPSA